MIKISSQDETKTDISLGMRTAQPPNNLRALRRQAQMTQKELARRAGTVHDIISRLERGDMTLSPAWMRRLAPILNCRPFEFLTGEEDDTLGPRNIAVVGMITAEDRAHMFEGKLRRIEFPFWENSIVVGWVIEADLLPRYERGDVIVCRKEDAPPDAHLGKECIVKTVLGNVYLKTLTASRELGAYTLVSPRESPILGVQVAWATPVLYVCRAAAVKTVVGV